MPVWNELTPRERAELMALFAREGVTDVNTMRSIYDSGEIEPSVVSAEYPRGREVVDMVNSSGANFVGRLKDPDRKTIPDWESDGYIATHKLGSIGRDGRNYVIPLVQEIDGELYDFTDPKYGFEDPFVTALDHALLSGDYVELPKESDARWFAESYKGYYPGFNKYKDGGGKDNGVDAISGADPPAVDTDPMKSKTAWFDWWYRFRDDQIESNRKNSGRLIGSKERYKKRFIDYVNNRLNAVGESYNDIDGKVDAPESIGPASEDSVARRQILNFGSDFGYDDYDKSADFAAFLTRGSYSPRLNHIIYTPKDGKLPDDTMIHERTHVLRGEPYYHSMVKERSRLSKSGVSALVDDNDFDSYLDSATEVYARLNAFRYANGLNPSHIYSKEEIGRFRRDGLLKRYDLDRYTDDHIYFLLNGLADSGEDVDSKSDINSAAFGGSLDKYSTGGDKNGKSEVMVRLGEDDYLHQGELDPAVVTAEAKKPVTYIPREYFNIVDDKPSSPEETALRSIVDSIVRKDKSTPLTILDGYRSAYDNPFVANPFASAYPYVKKFVGGGLKDTWKPWYWFTPEYEGKSLKEAIFRAYDDGLKGKNIIYNGRAYKAALNDRDELEYDSRNQHEENRKITGKQVVDSYIDNVMWTMENPNDKGLGKDGLYRPYADSSSPKNIGPGINCTSDEGKDLDFSGKTGYTKEFLNDHMRSFLNKKMDVITDDLHDMRGDDADTLSLGNRMIFLDIAHNVSPRDKKANMPSYWKKLVKAMFDGNLANIRKETYSGSKRRQEMRNDLIWKNYVDEKTVRNR